MRLSIVIPTRNRAEQLRHALASAVEQTFDDYEIIVSNNNSDDHTDEVVRSFDDARITYFPTQQSLPMPDHWEFAVGKASGEWVLLLCDDDALLPDCLSYLDRVIRDAGQPQIIQYALPMYCYQGGGQPAGELLGLGDCVPFFVQDVHPRRQMARCFWRLSGDMPKFLNAAVHRDLISRLRDRYGRVFGKWGPDYYVGLKLLANADTYVKTGPLAVWGENMASYGSGSEQDPNHLLEFFHQFEDFRGTLDLSPYPDLITIQNLAYDTIARCRLDLGPDFRWLKTNPVRLRRLLLTDVERYLNLGHNQYRDAQKQLRRDLAWHQIAQVAHAADHAKNLLRRIAAGRQWIERRRVRRWQAAMGGPPQPRRFENIYAAAQWVGQRLRWCRADGPWTPGRPLGIARPAANHKSSSPTTQVTR